MPELDAHNRTINGRPYVVRYAGEVQIGEVIWTQTEDGYELWTVIGIEDNSKPNSGPLFPTGREGFILFKTVKGSVMHLVNAGVYVDIKRGK